MEDELIVDLHLHSHYSRATSKDMNIASLFKWGKIKGIDIIGTGDFTHPEYFEELQEKLEPAEEGLFRLKDEFVKDQNEQLSENLREREVRFILTVEISNIYKRHDSARRLHNLVIMPSFEAVSEFNSRLGRIGNLKSDGRPILGLDSRDLLEITLETDDYAYFVPAHIWTPWFAMFGSKSGFDSIEEAFGDLSDEIKTVETGLSSDPFMNWRLSELDGITLTSNSDAHSPAKMGREANIYKGTMDYKSLIKAMRTGNEDWVGTIEFFPEEGKYHADGHKKCEVSLTPEETKKVEGRCPRCGGKLTVGVLHRVSELADRSQDFEPNKHKRVEYIIPLVEIIAEVEGVKGVNSKTVQIKYHRMLSDLGDEFSILRKVPLGEIRDSGFEKMALAIEKMRNRDVHVVPGYDGVFGTIKVYASKDDMKKEVGGQLGLI